VTIDYATETSKLTFVKEDRGALVGAAVEGTPASEGPVVLIAGAGASTSNAQVVPASERLAS
jgi:hypothetical protein